MTTTGNGRRIHLRTCPLCEAMCGLEVHVRDDRVELIRGDRQDVWSKGYLCPKGATLGHLHHDPDRLRAPVVRQPDGTFREVTWDLRSNNSWMHNVPVLVKGKDRCTLLLHPDDAARYGIVDGAPAKVSSESGSLVVTAEVTDAIKPGVVSLPHGWGHDKPGTRLSVASEHAGVNTNVLSPGGFVDVLSGNAAVNGIPVTVSAG